MELKLQKKFKMKKKRVEIMFNALSLVCGGRLRELLHQGAIVGQEVTGSLIELFPGEVLGCS